MAKITYITNNSHNREAQSISFDIADDLNINEFKIVCVRLAHAMGYHYKSIERTFGDLEHETKSDRDFKKFIKEVAKLTGSLQL